MILQIMIKVLKIHSFLKNEQGPTLTDVKSKKTKSGIFSDRGKSTYQQQTDLVQTLSHK